MKHLPSILTDSIDKVWTFIDATAKTLSSVPSHLKQGNHLFTYLHFQSFTFHHWISTLRCKIGHICFFTYTYSCKVRYTEVVVESIISLTYANFYDFLPSSVWGLNSNPYLFLSKWIFEGAYPCGNCRHVKISVRKRVTILRKAWAITGGRIAVNALFCPFEGWFLWVAIVPLKKM